MNEQETADALAYQLDALVTGEPLPSSSGELAELLQIAERVRETAPNPRPEFGPALKQSLLTGAFGNGAASGLAFTSWLIVIAVVSLMGLLATIGLIVGFGTKDDQISPGGNDSAPAVVPAKTSEGQATLLPVGATATGQATESRPISLPTVIIDVIPPLTGTGDDTVELELPSDLVPGHDSGSGSDGVSDSRDADGDHNRGHGNDRDHHDEDNPGRRRD